MCYIVLQNTFLHVINKSNKKKIYLIDKVDLIPKRDFFIVID